MGIERGKKLRAETRLFAYRKTLSDYLTKKGNTLNDAMRNLDSEIQKLEDEVTRLTTPVGDKYPELDEKNVEKLNKLYSNALLAAGNITKMKGGFFGKSSRLSLMQGIAAKTEKMLASDLRAIKAAAAGMGGTLVEALENSRNTVIDVSNVELGRVGGAQSARLPMTLKNSSGFKKAGLFTKEETYRKFDATNKYLTKLSDMSPKPLQNAIKSKMLQPDASRMDVSQTFAFFAAATTSDLPGMERSLGLPQSFLSDTKNITPQQLQDFKNALVKTANERNKAHVKDSFAYYAQALNDGANIDDRNVSMTAVAQLLGVSNLLANSVPMTITSDGIETKGTFMEFARGYMDVVYPKENDPVFSAKFPEALDGSDGLKAAADLQILDYICGNMDRHFGNIFYKFSKNEDGKVVFEGVKGIDNDGSFSVANVKNGIASLAALKNLKVISSDMANVIKNITPEHLSLVLKGSKLNAAELRAAGDRLLQIKERLLEPDKYPEKIRVVEKDAWVNEKLDDLVPPVNQAGVQEKNIFSQIKTAFSSAQIEVMKQRAKAANAAEKALTEVGLKKRNVSVDYRKAEDKITTVVENLEKARLWFRGSKEYKDMLIAARACKTMLNDYNSGKKEIPGIDQHFSKMLEVMKERTNNYINKKAADGAAKVSSNTVKRVLAAYDTLDFICKFGEKQELSLRQDYHLQNFEANNNQPQRERAASLTEAKSRPDTNIVGLNL